MNRQILWFAIAGSIFASSSFAQDAFDVQAAMEEVRQENLQRIGVERQQQIVSIMRKRAEDLSAIEAAGFVLTDDGKLVKKQSTVGPSFEPRPSLVSAEPTTTPSSGGSTSALFSEQATLGQSQDSMAEILLDGSDESFEASPSAPSMGRLPFRLTGIFSNSALLSTGTESRRYGMGDSLPGGFVLERIEQDSVQVRSSNGAKRTIFMDWSSASKVRSSNEPDGDGSRVYMQSGADIQMNGGGQF